ADRVCVELRKGRTLRSITGEPDMPSRLTVLTWADKDPIFANQYARALADGIDELAELTVDEASVYIAQEDVPAARVKLDARKWYLGKRAPKKYGDKLDVTAAVLTADVTPPPTDQARVRALSALLAKVKAKTEEGIVDVAPSTTTV